MRVLLLALLTLFIFVIVFIMASGYHLYAHVYSEDKGKKGGNNVVSMLHAQLKQLNLLREDETGGELTIIADNCGGQNKNNFLLRYIVYLVERKFYKKVRVLFLVAGHTKNHCDRHFNLLKVRYSKSNVFDMKGALETLGHVEEHVTALEADEFHKWGDLLDELYNKLGNINKWHNFEAELDGDGKLSVQVGRSNLDNAEKDTYYIAKERVVNRDDILKKLPVVEPEPGLRAIKQVELYKKWRPLVPHEFKDILCPKPPQEILDEVADTAREKRGRKQSALAMTQDEKDFIRREKEAEKAEKEVEKARKVADKTRVAAEKAALKAKKLSDKASETARKAEKKAADQARKEAAAAATKARKEAAAAAAKTRQQQQLAVIQRRQQQQQGGQVAVQAAPLRQQEQQLMEPPTWAAVAATANSRQQELGKLLFPQQQHHQQTQAMHAAHRAVQDTSEGLAALELETPVDVAREASKRDETESAHSPNRLPRNKRNDDRNTPKRS
jgi:hypothetical protein